MIPKIDSEIGILVYSTAFAGCGGQIRKNKEDFIVDEILSENSIDKIKENDGYAVPGCPATGRGNRLNSCRAEPPAGWQRPGLAPVQYSFPHA